MSNTGVTIETIIQADVVNIGDWCIFKTDRHRSLIGLEFSFSYMTGKTFKDKRFARSSALINSKKSIGVLCTYYHWAVDGQLENELVPKHEFINILQSRNDY